MALIWHLESPNYEYVKLLSVLFGNKRQWMSVRFSKTGLKISLNGGCKKCFNWHHIENKKTYGKCGNCPLKIMCRLNFFILHELSSSSDLTKTSSIQSVTVVMLCQTMLSHFHTLFYCGNPAEPFSVLILATPLVLTGITWQSNAPRPVQPGDFSSWLRLLTQRKDWTLKLPQKLEA